MDQFINFYYGWMMDGWMDGSVDLLNFLMFVSKNEWFVDRSA